MSARLIAAGLLSLLYLLGTHWLMTSAAPSPWNAVVLLTPMLGAIAFGAWQARQRGRATLALAGIAALCAQAATGVLIPAPLLYLGQHVGINLMLGCWFASSLRAGGEALITAMAARVHDHMSVEMRVYTRRLTRVWVIYFFAVAAASVLVFVTASFDHWAEFSNLFCPATIALMFVGERLLRYRLHPEFERVSLADQIRAYTQFNGKQFNSGQFNATPFNAAPAEPRKPAA